MEVEGTIILGGAENTDRVGTYREQNGRFEERRERGCGEGKADSLEHNHCKLDGKRQQGETKQGRERLLRS